ncbi:2Fe-2S iron-sulfur cluster-binding protein [Trinickia sp. NRRL B-1857]|uniref:2Fe-2S iron-sulfur cluster-binding protein n=1 Tax=Trinickia sp. NRRL B-1857 TaxID=3162879 RepID=UPI003D275130
MTSSPAPRIVRIEPHGYSFESSPSVSLLEAATAAQVRLPRSCRNGSCRTCMCRLISGTVSYRIEWPGLTKEEKNEGWVLPCVALAETDLVLLVPEAEIDRPQQK